MLYNSLSVWVVGHPIVSSVVAVERETERDRERERERSRGNEAGFDVPLSSIS